MRPVDALIHAPNFTVPNSPSATFMSRLGKTVLSRSAGTASQVVGEPQR